MTFDVSRWLADIGLQQYTEAFLAHGFDGPGLAKLTDAKLLELGVAAMGHRKTIQREAAQLVKPVTETHSQPDHSNSVTGDTLQPQTTNRGRVFLSYGHDPACLEIVQRIKLDLQTAGWDPWMDKERIL